MMKISSYPFVFTGLAIFSMFFGAGNVVFPLALGQISGNGVLIAVFGLLLTGIILPLAGLIAMILFNGDYYAFFQRIGRFPGLFLILVVMALIGPFAAIPRTITLSYSTFALTWMDFPAWIFNSGFCMAVLLLAYRRDAVLGIIGTILTPILLGFLAWTVIDGLWTPAFVLVQNNEAVSQHFVDGIFAGYNTLDMLGGLFFSTVVIAGLHNKLKTREKILAHLVKGAAVAGSLLFAAYGGFCYIAAKHAGVLEGVPTDELLGRLALHLLGGNAGLMANGVVTIACLTTAVSLTAVFAEFLSRHFFNDPDKMYGPFVILTVLISFGMSLLGFMKIVELIFPIIFLCYPMLIALVFCNICHKLYDFKPVKIPVYGTLVLTVLCVYLHHGTPF